jgi:hypothetical protein
MRVRCGAICLIALFVALSDQEFNQEGGASKQLAPPLSYTHLPTAIVVLSSALPLRFRSAR